MAFQQAGLFEWRTVARNIELPLELKGWDKAKRRARAREMLELVKLRRLRRAHAVAAVRWHAAAGRHRPRARRAPAAPADGRAVRRARRDDARAHAGRAAAHLRRRPAPPSCSSPTRIPEAVYLVEPRRRDVAAARVGSPTSSTCSSAADRDEDTREDAGFFEMHHRSPRSAARWRRRGGDLHGVPRDRGPMSRSLDARQSRALAAAARVRRAAVRRLAAGGVVLRHPAVLPRRAHRHLDRGSSTTSTNVWAAMRVSGTNAFVGLVLGSDPRRRDVVRAASRFRVLDEIVTPLSIGAQRDPDRSCSSSVFNNMFAHHQRGAAPADGHARRVLRRAGATSPRACARWTRRTSS